MKKIFITLLITICLLTGNCVFANLARWENPKGIKVYIVPDNDKMLMKKAFNQWSMATNGKITFIFVPSSDKAQITVSFHKTLPKISENTERGGMTSAHTIPPEEKIIDIAHIYIAKETTYGWIRSSDELYLIMLHEIGHAIGILEHSNENGSIMNPRTTNRHITKLDIANLKKVYGWK